MKDYGGIFVKAPVFGAFFILAALSSVGLPGLNGFIGEFTILLGTFGQNVWLAVLGTFGIILAAWYLLTAVRRVLFGPLNPDNDNLVDMNAREVVAALPLVIFFFILGLFPNLLFDKINPSAEAIVTLSNQEQTLSQLRITNVE
jgi:NADH-quinone oxidoreductase subunit M